MRLRARRPLRGERALTLNPLTTISVHRGRSVQVLWLYGALPCVIGIPVLLGILSTIGYILGEAHPDLGWAHTVANDAKAVALGERLYADPAETYSGMLYGPVYPLVLAPLYLLHWWDGWPPLVSTLAGLMLGATVGIISAMPVAEDGPRRGFAVLGGVGLGGFVWWLVSANPEHFLYEGRSDQVAWCFALVGLCVLAWGVTDGRRRRTWPGVVLLVAAMWTKQTTLGASLAALVAMTVWMLMGALPPGAWRRFCVALLLSNAVVLAALNITSRGWAWHFLVTLPSRHQRDPGVAKYLTEVRTLFTPLVLLLVIPTVALVLSERTRALVRARWRQGSLPFSVALGSVLVLFVVFSFPPVWLARHKQGGDANQYVGIMWAVGLMIAIVHRECRRRAWLMVVVASTTILLVIPVAVPALQPAVLAAGISYPRTFPVVDHPSLPPTLISYARDHDVYLPDRGLITVTRRRHQWPTQWNVIDLLAAGDEPGYLLNALIDRRFDAVAHFDVAWDDYASGYGRRRGGYLAMLNAVIDRGYARGANGAPGSLLGRRAGVLDLDWMRACFEPGALPARCQRLTAPAR